MVRYIPRRYYVDDKGALDTNGIEEKIKDIHWTKVYNRHGKVTRSSAWYTANSCSCTYVYGKDQKWDPIPFEPWMYDAASKVSSMFAIPEGEQLDSINFNKYEDFSQSLYFHFDDEKLFQKKDGTANIISLSFGVTRTFAFKLGFEPDDKATAVRLESGDLLSMQGKMQQFYSHAVLPDNPDDSGAAVRYNATFRFVANHHRKCPRHVGTH